MVLDNNIKELISAAMGSIKSIVEVNTIIGEPVTAADGTMIIPVTKVSCGFGAGGCELPGKNNQTQTAYPFGGGSGGGLKVEPVAFLVICNNNVKVIPVGTNQSAVEKLLDMVPELIDKVNQVIGSYLKKDEEPETPQQETEETQAEYITT